MSRKEQEEFNHKVADLLDDIVWNLALNTNNSIRPDTQENLWGQVASIKGLLQP